MTDADIIRAVAEFDGYSNIGISIYGALTGMRGNNQVIIPPYLSSLDAIVPVTEKLDEQQKRTFWDLIHIAGIGRNYLGDINATARQCCIALLRTIGKYLDT